MSLSLFKCDDLLDDQLAKLVCADLVEFGMAASLFLDNFTKVDFLELVDYTLSLDFLFDVNAIFSPALLLLLSGCVEDEVPGRGHPLRSLTVF